jgi:hypothetical protein
MNPSQDRLGEVVAGYALDRDGLILLGWSGEDMPAQGIAILPQRQPGKGRFGSLTMTDDQKRRWFLLIVHGPNAGLSRSGDRFQLHGAGARSSTTAYTPTAMLGAEAFAAEMLARLGARMSDAVQFLMEVFPAFSSAAPEPVRALIVAVLQAAAEEAGVVEILGRAEGEGLLLQGWMRDAHRIEPRLLIESGALQEHSAAFGTFSRSDLAAPALGFAALVRFDEHGVTTVPRQVYIRSDNRYRRLTVLPNAVHLRDEEVPQHLNSLVATLRADAASQKAFRAASRPRFTGQDTVSGLPLPVRMAVDVAACVPGAGWYVTGWLLDPLDLVSAVLLRGAGGMGERLDARWTRLARDDVSAGFRDDPLFAAHITGDHHGFAVFVPGDAAESRCWIELDLGSHGAAFLPIAITAAAGLSERKRLLATVDLHKAAATEIIERQLGPLFHATGAAAETKTAYRTLRQAAGRDARTALIVPLAEDGIKSNIVVSHLAGTALGSDVRVVFVCSPHLTDVLRRLPRDLEFYGFPADVLVAAEAVDGCEALAIGVDATDSTHLVFLSPRCHALAPNWLQELVAALDRQGDLCAVSPTLLYEDGSVRYAGIDSVEFAETAPYGAMVCARAGYPRDALPKGQIAPTFSGMLDCCAMTRAAFAAAGGFGHGYALDGFKGADLFMRLGAAGARVLWAAGVELYALDDLQANSEHSAQVGVQVDGWCFKAAWQGKALPQPAADLSHVPHLRAVVAG